jgi:5-methyltetrahydrofolate--homocysteine methyltransferase
MGTPGTIGEACATRVLVGDGAMGTQLQAAGLEPGSCGEVWNLRHPDRVEAIQRAYVDAGADCLTTNTFGASPLGLSRHGLKHELLPINREAVVIARRAFGGRPGFVLGDIGPFGGLLEPYGTFSPAEVREGFAAQARILVEAGVDAILIETMTSLEELELSILAAREAGAPWVIATMAFDAVRGGEDFRTMMGVSPEQAAESMARWGTDMTGANCGAGVDSARSVEIARRMRRACGLPLAIQPNAGTPELQSGRIVYPHEPAAFASEVLKLTASGVRLVGACCGSTPDHIAAIREQLK